MSEEKNKGGRPPVVLTPEQINQVEALAGFLSVEQIADYFGVSHVTFGEIQTRQPDVSLAYKRGRSRAFAGVGKGLLQRALEGDNTAAIFYAKTQMRWREPRDEDEQKAEPQKIEVVFVSTEKDKKD